MKAILSVALVLTFCGLARAAEVDPVGTWKCQYKIGDQDRTSSLTIKKEGDKLVGTMSWPDQKEAKLTDLKLEKDVLTFSAERVLGTNKIPVEYKFKIAGDQLKGTGVVESGGQKNEFDIEGKREKGEQ